MINKGFILKTAAVALCVSVLILTGCRGGNNEAAAVKNNSEEGVKVNAVSDGDGQAAVKGVVRSTEPERDRVQAESDDSEREESKDGREPKVTSEAEPSEDGDSVLTEEDRGTVDGSAPVGTGEGSEDDSAVSESISVAESASDMGDGEYTDDEDGWYEPDTAGVEAEEGFTEEYSDSGVDEAGYSDGTGDNLIYQGEFLVTFYDDCEACCGRAGATTASGVYPTAGHTIAADGYDFGTVLYIEGFGYYVVEDRGVPYGMIDIFVNDHSEIPSYGITTASVYLVN